ncbi:hypothetical protein NG785_06545, partial [Aliarcobacter cryaerophilus]
LVSNYFFSFLFSAFTNFNIVIFYVLFSVARSHRLETRIKAHILISFVSYAIYKEFERKLKINDVKFNFSQKLLRKIIEHLIALKIDDEIIHINPSEIQKQILDIL